ncbi:MAG: cation-translocating P-type ATPase, partial [Proteobacteria bacterium]|nr:cation-translocating P-type ATPase [Pseudomonadota bacterium]
EVSLDALAPGDRVVVRPGDLVPVDGGVRTGRSKIDQSPVTGESHYETVAPGATVFAGTLNLDGMIEVEVEHVGEGTVLGRVVDLLRVVEGSKVPAIRLLEHFSAAYLPVVLAVAATVLFFSDELDRAITVLVVACPTALVLAGPAAVVAAMTAATRRSILVKSAEFLERMGDVDTLILDKTGTVTEGRQVIRTVTAIDCEDAEVLAAGAVAAEGSLHPVSRAIVEAAAVRELTVERADETTEFPGLGVEARVAGHIVLVGRRSCT